MKGLKFIGIQVIALLFFAGFANAQNLSPYYSELRPLLMKDYSIPLEDGIADLIVMINLHHEIEDPLAILTECYRLLRPGGKIAISDWKKEDTGHGPALEIRFETGEVESQLSQCGFMHLVFI